MDNSLYGESYDLLGYTEDVPDYYNSNLDGADGVGEDYSMPFEMAEARNDKRARAQAIARIRARQKAQQRGRPRVGGAPARYIPSTTPARQPASTGLVSKGFEGVGRDVQKINASVQNVDLESKLQADMLGRSLTAQGQRIKWNQYAIAASAFGGVLQQLPAISGNQLLKNAVAVAPLALLRPETKGSGAGAILSDPRVLGFAAIAGLALFNHFSQDKVEEPAEVKLAIPSLRLPAGETFFFHALARDSSGKVIAGRSFTWRSMNADIATVDLATGFVKAVGPGSVTIIATDTATNLQGTAEVTVDKASAAGKSVAVA